MLAANQSGTGQWMAQRLLPHLLAFIVSATEVEGASVRSGVSKTLSIFGTLLSGQQGEAVFGETAARILELAGMDQPAFRAVVSGMDPEMRGLLEQVLREGHTAKTKDNEQDLEEQGSEPSIALKMDFGSS